jgi:ribosome-associated translation inhibitor RaiA
MNDPQINIQDIECPTLRGQVKTILEDIIQLCPSDSTVRATVRKLHDRFVAEIRVASENVVMQAIDQATALAEVLEHIQTKMLTQIVDWRSHRFVS